jgi:ribosomal-protein-alanine N-acetyltransferase
VVTYDGEMVGQLTVTGVTWGSARWAQMGYWIDQGFAGRGIIPVAVALACDHCLLTMRLHRVEIAIRPENVASLRVVEKLGFSQIGLAPRYLHINGQWRDHLLFAITAEEVPEGVLARLDERDGPTS